MPDRTLILLLDEFRGKTLRILDAVPDEYTRWALPGLQVERLSLGALGRTAQMPTAGSRCSPGRAPWYYGERGTVARHPGGWRPPASSIPPIPPKRF